MTPAARWSPGPTAGETGLPPAGPAGRSRWWRVALTLVPVLGFLGVLVYGMTRDPRATSSPLVGRPAPDFTLTLFDGRQVRLSELWGKVVVTGIGSVQSDFLMARMEEALQGTVSAAGRGRDFRSVR